MFKVQADGINNFRQLGRDEALNLFQKSIIGQAFSLTLS